MRTLLAGLLLEALGDLVERVAQTRGGGDGWRFVGAHRHLVVPAPSATNSASNATRAVARRTRENTKSLISRASMLVASAAGNDSEPSRRSSVIFNRVYRQRNGLPLPLLRAGSRLPTRDGGDAAPRSSAVSGVRKRALRSTLDRRPTLARWRSQPLVGLVAPGTVEVVQKRPVGLHRAVGAERARVAAGLDQVEAVRCEPAVAGPRAPPSRPCEHSRTVSISSIVADAAAR